jgi:hypothetical protein
VNNNNHTENKYRTKKFALKSAKKYCTIIATCEFSQQYLHDWRK